jgi:uncharacterized protein YPO0396
MEVVNWGTFDSERGSIHVLPVNGETSLVVGQNGSGKSTLVDALLTLLVRPVVRNYNVAAGSLKQERDERSYIKGAYGSFSRDEDNRAAVQFLRPRVTNPSVLLACFRSEESGKAFTVAQLLYLDSDGNVKKVYCFAPDQRSIATDFCDLKGTERIHEQLRRRGLRVTTSYVEYYAWFAKETGVQAKAMDMFNQTVAVKDIQKLNAFIRNHMLEAKPWGKRVEGLLSHFTQLSEAHKSLVDARRQLGLLNPIADAGDAYRTHEHELNRERQLLDATDSFFRSKTIEMFEPECASRRAELAGIRARIKQSDLDLFQVREECRRLKNEIEQSGGERLRQIPLLVEGQKSQLVQKRDLYQTFRTALRESGVDEAVTDPRTLTSVRARLTAVLADCERQINEIDIRRNDAVIRRAETLHRLREDEQELEALSKRRENLPERFAELRRRLCEDLRLPLSDLPFVSELIAVKPEERLWVPSVEMVLRGIALSLLVPERHYPLVSQYVNATKIRSATGEGQKLVYLRVGQVSARRDSSSIGVQSLLHKLAFREGHPLLPWVRAELANRFDYRCCETVEEFQACEGRAMTRERHLKIGGVRHEKDDRERSSDPRYFVLGWDNREKRRLLAESVQRLRTSASEVERLVVELSDLLATLRSRQAAARRGLEVSDFSTIDFAQHERAIKALQKERQAIEEGCDAIRLLKRRLAEEESRHTLLTRNRDDAVRRESELCKEIESGQRAIANATAILKERASQHILAKHEESFKELEAEFVGNPLKCDDLFERERSFTEQRHQRLDRLRVEVTPLLTSLQKVMSRFLVEFPAARADLQPDSTYLDSFLDLRSHLIREDLPRHEQRFKERLNEKVTQELGLFNGALQSECAEIKKRIELLNVSLRQLEYRPGTAGKAGTFMRLETRPVHDREINDFQQSIKECLADVFEGTLEADEARYRRIEKLIVRLREEPKWREKVADVRRWFDFAAREIDAETDQERGYYEDSTGQSGGEKAKLAFTILVAAIAYQYNLVPDSNSCDRFRFVVVDEMFSKVDDQYAEYALELFQKFGLQLLIVAPLDAKARVTEPYVGCYLHVVKDDKLNHSQILSMTAREFAGVVDEANRNDAQRPPEVSRIEVAGRS